MPFLKFLFYAIAPLLVLWGMFVMKRGRIRYKKNLRELALLIWSMAGLKLIFVDVKKTYTDIFCDQIRCIGRDGVMLNFITLVLLIAGVIFWSRLYQRYIPDSKKYIPIKTDLSPLKQWVILSFLNVTLFILWVLGPWVTSLSIGRVPKIFLTLSWHYIGILAAASLIMAFWKLEDYQWYYSSTKSGVDHKKNVWVPKDTLWTLLFIFAFTAMMAFASSRMIAEAALKMAG